MIETMRDFIGKIDDLGIEYMATGSYAIGKGITLNSDQGYCQSYKLRI